MNNLIELRLKSVEDSGDQDIEILRNALERKGYHASAADIAAAWSSYSHDHSYYCWESVSPEANDLADKLLQYLEPSQQREERSGGAA